MAETKKIPVAVFASDKGRGDAERASIMSQTGTFLAKRGAQIICPAHRDGICVPLIKSASAAGGDVVVLAQEGFTMPSALSGIACEAFVGEPELYRSLSGRTRGFLGLPGSLGSVTALFECWTASGMSKPVALLNRNRAYEVIRGFAADILSHSTEWERHLQVSDNIEDLWNRLTKALNAR